MDGGRGRGAGDDEAWGWGRRATTSSWGDGPVEGGEREGRVVAIRASVRMAMPLCICSRSACPSVFQRSKCTARAGD